MLTYLWTYADLPWWRFRDLTRWTTANDNNQAAGDVRYWRLIKGGR